MAESLLLLIFPIGMILAGSMDFLTMTIPNRIAFGLLAGFLILAVFNGMPMVDIGAHFLAGLAMLAAGFALFCAGWIGGGDAKLFAVTALWLGWSHVLEYTILASLCGGLLTLVIIVARRLPIPDSIADRRWAVRLLSPSSGIPYGIALAAAGLIVYPQTLWMNG